MIADVIPKVAAMEPDDWKFAPRPSLSGPERCIRQLVYYALDVPKAPLPGRAVLVFDDSSWHEELTADWIRKTAFKLHSEQMVVRPRLPIRAGHIDYIATDMIDVDRLIEHKAINHFTFQRIWDEEWPLDNFTQLALYMDAIQQKLNPEMKEGLLLLKNKNNAQYLEFRCAYEFDTLTVIEKSHSDGTIVQLKDVKFDGLVQGAVDKMNAVLDYAKRKTLPRRQYFVDHWRCEYCQWHKVCWKEYEKEYEAMKTEVMMESDVADMLRYYKELGGQKSDITKEHKEIGEQVKDIMRNMSAREGRAGEYLCKLNLIKGQKLDKSKLSEKAIAEASVPYFYERLSIAKPKPKKEKKKKKVKK